MNSREFKCSRLLKDLVENEGVIGIKTSFEDEGATFNEVMRLKEICNQADTKLTLKIGGPEAVRDMMDSSIIGVKGLVGPMVESAFGLKKYITAINNNIPESIIPSLNLYINVETINGVNDIDNISKLPEFEQLHGVTVGRVDLVGSLGKDRKFVDSDEMYSLVKKVFTKVKSKGLKACMGGAVSIDSLDFLKRLYSEGLLDKFETRYVIFDPSISLKNLSRALAKAQAFEYEWLVCKSEAHQLLADRESKRIKMTQDRLSQSVSS